MYWGISMGIPSLIFIKTAFGNEKDSRNSGSSHTLHLNYK